MNILSICIFFLVTKASSGIHGAQNCTINVFKSRGAGRAASGGALAPQPPRATRSQPEPIEFSPKNNFFSFFRVEPVYTQAYSTGLE